MPMTGWCSSMRRCRRWHDERCPTFLIEPFDIMLHATEEGVQSLQARFSTWLRTLREPARFVC
jgi:hypothetical protein